MSSASRGEQCRPIVDRACFQQLLEAAYVLQLHNEQLSRKNPGLPGPLRELQLTIARSDLDLRAAAELIAERLHKISNASGVSICLVQDGSLRPIACAGFSARAPGGAVSANSLVATERLCNGNAFHSPDAERDVRLDLAMCQHSGLGSLLAVPIPGEEGVAGLIELRTTSKNAFAELEESCRWTAALMGELLRHDTRSTAGAPSQFLTEAEFSAARQPERPALALAKVPQTTFDPRETECRVCGEPLREDEVFCGHCSMPRPAGGSQENLQGKWASMWYMQRAQEAVNRDKPDESAGFNAASSPGASGRGPQTESCGFAPLGADAPGAGPVDSRDICGPLGAPVAPGRLARFAQPLVATLKRVFTAQSTALRTKRVVLVSAVIVFLFVLLQLSAYRPSLRSERSWVDSLLGVAQAPVRTPAVSGNPDVRVWVDVNTALYYCPGSRLYGKTPGGHFARQRVARQNQFGPASRTPCW